MGEKLRDLKEISLGEAILMVEQNKGTHAKGDYDIHIQNKTFRLNISEHDFYKMVCCVLYAKENLNSYKGKR